MTPNRLTVALDEFQASLSPEQKAKLLSNSGNVPTPDDAIRLTTEINKDNSQRKGRVWAQRMGGILHSIQQFCAIGDTLVQSRPEVAALVWGSVKLAILAATNYTTYFDNLSRQFEKLGKYCPRVREYEKLFKDSARVKDALSNFYAVVIAFCTKALKGIQETTFKQFAKSIIRPYKDDFGPFEENLSAAKNEVDEELRLAAEQKAHTSRELQQIEYDSSEQFRVNFYDETNENQRFRELQLDEARENQSFRSQQLVVMADKNQRALEKSIRGEERYKIRLLQKICNYDYTWSLRIARQLRCPTSGSWLFERPEYKDWVAKRASQCLWCCGTAGRGKTVLTGHVIDRLLASASQSPGDRIAYYFFDWRRPESLSVLNFLRSILHQLLQPNMTPDFQRRVEALFVGALGVREPIISELRQFVLDICAGLKIPYILIDGLDEVTSTEIKDVLLILKDMPSHVNIFVSSQPEVDLSNIFSKFATITLSANVLEQDIRSFVDTEVDKDLVKYLGGYNSTVIESIKEVLAVKAEGMFLWASLQIKAMCCACEEDRTPDRIPQLLDDLPRGIRGIYSRALERLLQSENPHTETARRIFQWVVCAQRPLGIPEIEEAVTIQPGQKSWKEPSIRLSRSTISKLCGNLIAFDEAEDTVFLSHHSVLQFLRTCKSIPSISEFQLDLAETDRYLGDICITYLSFADFEKSLTRTPDTRTLQTLAHPAAFGIQALPILRKYKWDRNSARRPLEKYLVSVEEEFRSIMASGRSSEACREFQLLEYCRLNWYHHCAGFSLDIGKRLERLENLILRKQLPFHWRPWDDSNTPEPLPPSQYNMELFKWALKHMHVPILHVWEISMAKTSIPTSEPWKTLYETDAESMLFSACKAGNLELLDMLMKKCLRIDATPIMYKHLLSMAIAHAASSGHLPILNFLFQENFQFIADAARIDGKTALQAAAARGDIAIVKLLLRHRADVNAVASPRHGRTALQAAAEGGHLRVVDLLLLHGADVNAAASPHHGRTALQAAAEGGHLRVVQLLLRYSADVNAEASIESGRTALEAAAGGGHLAIAQLLLRPNASIKDSSSLRAAAAGGHVEVLTILLQRGADPDAPDGRGNTALVCAVAGEHMAAVKLLLQHGAKVDTYILGKQCRPALHAAAESGNLAIVEYLLVHGASIHPYTNIGETGWLPLHAAAAGGHLTVVKCLLKNGTGAGANVDCTPASDPSGWTALQVAAKGGHFGVVEQLLEYGASVNPQISVRGGRGTALQAAAASGNLALVKHLLSYQPSDNPNIQKSNTKYSAELQAAAREGHLAISELLIQYGADINAFDDSNQNALQASAGRGHLAVVQLLLGLGAEVDGIALRGAAEGGYLAVVQLLLQHGAMIYGKNGETALQAAAQGGYTAIIELLLRHNSRIVRYADEASDTALRAAFRAAAAEGHHRVVKLLLMHTSDTLYPGEVLECAAARGHLGIVETLIKCWDIMSTINYFTGTYFKTALGAAAAGGHLWVAKLLLDQDYIKVNVDAPSITSNRTPLQAAAAGGHLLVVELLLQYDAKVNLAGDGKTALQEAQDRNYRQIVERLLLAGAGGDDRHDLECNDARLVE